MALNGMYRRLVEAQYISAQSSNYEDVKVEHKEDAIGEKTELVRAVTGSSFGEEKIAKETEYSNYRLFRKVTLPLMRC